MIFKLFRFFLVFIFLIIITIFSISYYAYKKYFNQENIKNYLISQISKKTEMDVSISEIKFSPPDNFIITDLMLSNINSKILIKKLSINIKLYKILDNKSELPFENIDIENGKIDINISSQTENLNIDLKDIPSIKLKNTEINITNGSNYKIEIKDIKIERDFIIRNILKVEGFFDFESDIIKKVPIEISFKLNTENSNISDIEIKKLMTTIENNKITLNGNIKLNENKSQIELETVKEINLKNLLKIPYEIIIDKFNAKLLAKYSKDFLEINSYIKEINSNLSLLYDFKNRKILKFYINSKDIPSYKLKDVLDKYIKNHKGKIDLELTFENKEKKTLNIIANTNNLSFLDPFDIINFTNSRIKLILNQSFYALNATYLEGKLFNKNLNGWIKVDSNYINENITSNLKINNDTKLDSKIRIENINKPDKKKFTFDLFLSKFDLKEITEIFQYVVEKIEKEPSNPEGKYYMINKPFFINLTCDDVILMDYLKAKKAISKFDIKKFNRFSNIEGNFKIKLLSGVMENIDKNLDKNENYRLIFMPLNTLYQLNRRGALKIDSKLSTIHFSEIGINFDLNNAKIIIDKFYLNSDEFLIYSKGSIDSVNKTVDMKAYIINRKNYKKGTLPESLSDTKGRPALAFSINGSFNNPEIKFLDLENITNIVEKEVKEGINLN